MYNGEQFLLVGHIFCGMCERTLVPVAQAVDRPLHNAKLFDYLVGRFCEGISYMALLEVTEE